MRSYKLTTTQEAKIQLRMEKMTRMVYTFLPIMTSVDVATQYASFKLDI
jgi:hypothetical protein